MQDQTDTEFEPQEEKRSRKGVLLLFLLIAGAVGVASYTATRMSTPPQVAKTTEPAAKPAEQAKTAEAPAVQPEKPMVEQSAAATSETQVSASASAKVEVTPAPPSKPAEPQTVEKAEPAEQPVQQTTAKPEAAQPQQPAAAEQQVASAATPPPKPEAQEPAPALAPEPPSFDTVRVEPTGDALIAGRAAAGSEVVVKLNGAVIGKAKANDEGSFVLVPDQPLPAGAGALSLETDVGGKVVTSESTVAVAVKPQAKGEALVAVVKPQEPVAVIQAPTAGDTAGKSSKVVLDAVEYDDSGDIVFSGRSNAGNAIRIYVDNALVGEVTANADGKWTFNGKSTIAPGTHTLRADEIGKDGKVLSRVELPFLREEAAKVAAAAPQQPAAETAQPAKAEQGIGAVANKGNAAVPQRIVIQPGNNLWRLSRLVYGRGTRYTVIYEANKDQIRNPDLIYPGQVFAMPVTP